MIDFGPYRRGERTLMDLAAGLTRRDLARLTTEMCDLELSLVAGIEDADVVFEPEDKEANDTFAATSEEVGISWTLGHVVVHVTASSEEAAAQALTLARGVDVVGRSRREVPWESVRTAAELRLRIDESRRMRLAMLDAWPDQPRLEHEYIPAEGKAPWNAVARFISGLSHDDSHLEQIKSIVAQARAAR